MPFDFSNIIGNPKAKFILNKLLMEMRIPQLFLFQGPRGVGKSLFAQAVAHHLIGQKNNSDLHLLSPEPKNNLYLIDQLHALIRESSLSPFRSHCKIFILQDAERLPSLGSHTLLKLFEEPPAQVYFILLTHQPELLLPTLLSRCYKITFLSIPDKEMREWIKQKYPDQDAQKITFLSQGSLAKAVVKASLPHLSPLLQNTLIKTTSLQDKVKEIELIFKDQPEEELFDELLYWVREHRPHNLTKAIPFMIDLRKGMLHHIKLKSLLEYFLLMFLESE